MHDDKLDPRPMPDQFARVIAARAAAADSPPVNEVPSWLHSWHDREGTWTNLRNIEHWIDRAGV